MSNNEQEFSPTPPSRALHRFAVLSAVATFALVFIGGLVTSTGSALAVPDWPLAFGKLIPHLEGGVRFEYGHRVAAGVVMILTAILALWTGRVERRRWVRNTALAAIGLVVIQAILGGLTVLLQLPLPMAVAHAATAQAACCLMVAIALFTNPSFARGPRLEADDGRPGLAALTTLTTVAIYVQILIGAVMRHLGAGLAIPDFPLAFGRLVPPFTSIYVAINFAHRCGALVVAALVVWTVGRVIRTYRGNPILRRSALFLLALLFVQIILGTLTIWSDRAVLPTTAHVAVGAGVLAASFALTVRVYALRGRAGASESATAAMPTRRSLDSQVTA